MPRADLARFTGSNVRAAWGSAHVETKRAVFDALGMVVRLEPVGPGRKPGLEHITITWAERDKPESPSG